MIKQIATELISRDSPQPSKTDCSHDCWVVEFRASNREFRFSLGPSLFRSNRPSGGLEESNSRSRHHYRLSDGAYRYLA